MSRPLTVAVKDSGRLNPYQLMPGLRTIEQASRVAAVKIRTQESLRPQVPFLPSKK